MHNPLNVYMWWACVHACVCVGVWMCICDVCVRMYVCACVCVCMCVCTQQVVTILLVTSCDTIIKVYATVCSDSWTNSQKCILPNCFFAVSQYSAIILEKFFISLIMVVLDSRVWQGNHSFPNFHTSNNHLKTDFCWKYQLKCIPIALIML